MKRFFKRFLIGLALSIIVLITSGWAFLHFKHDTIRTKAEQAIDQHLDAWVTFDDLSISMVRDFPNITITLHNLLIVGKEEFARDTLASVKEFDLEIKTFSYIFDDKIELKSIHLFDPYLSFQVLKTGRANYDIFPTDSVAKITSATDSSSLNLALDEITISRGEIDYHDYSQNINTSLKNVTYSGTGDFQKDIFDFKTILNVGEFSLDYGNVRFLSRKEVEVDLIMEMNLVKNSYRLKENNLRINHFKFDVEGNFALLDEGYDFDLKFGAKETDFKNIISLIPGLFMKDFKEISTEGKMTFNGFVRGQYLPAKDQLPSLETTISIKDALFKIDTLPDPIENIQMELVISNLKGIEDSTIFDLKNFQFDMRKHVVKGRVRIQGIEQYKIDADVLANLDLAELEKMYPITGLELKGIADFELKAKGPLTFNQSKLEQLPFFHLNLKLKDGKVKYNHLPSAIDSIQFHLLADNQTGHVEKSVFDFRQIHLDLEKNRLDGHLRVEGYENMQINSDLIAELDLADLEKLFPVDGLVMKGNLSLNAKANGTYNASKKKFPSVDAKLALVNGFVQTRQYPEPLENIHLTGEVINSDGNFSDTRMAINRLTYTLEDEPFEVSGTVSDLDKYNYDIKIKGLVDLEKITKIYPIDGIQVKGIIDSDISSQGRLIDIENGNYENVVSTGKIEVKNLAIQSSFIPRPVSVSDALFTFNSSKIILEHFTGKFGRSNISLTGDLFNYMAFATKKNDLIKWDLDLKCDTLDLNEWLAEDTSRQVSKSNTPTPPAQINVWQIPVNVDAIFDSEIDNIFYEDMKITKMDGKVEMKDGVLTFHEAGFNSLNASFNISGDYDTRDMVHPLFDFDLEVQELDINKAYREVKLVRDLLPAAGDADGIFSVSYKLKGELAQDFSPKMEMLSGGGELRIANAKVNGMKIFEELSKAAKKKEVNDPHLKDFVMKSEIHDNKIFIKPFSIKVSGFDTDVEGISEITGAIHYIVKIDLPPFGLKIPFHVTGTYDKPKVAIGKGHSLPSDSSVVN